MKKTAGRVAIGNILQMMQDDEHITEDFRLFIDQCLSDYLYEKKLTYSLELVFAYRQEWLKPETKFKIKEKLSQAVEE
jgi:hypothetical protein